MKLFCDEMYRYLVRGMRATLPKNFTGKVTITLNFHAGTLGTATAGFEEGSKPGIKLDDE